MAEDPEQVLPKDRVATFGRDEEMGPEIPVHGQLDQSHGDHGEG